MVTGLFDSPTQPVAPPLAVEPPFESYRAVCGAAIAAVTVAALSPLAFVDWWLAAVPALGLVLAMLALRDIARRPLELTGRPLALAASCRFSSVLAPMPRVGKLTTRRKLVSSFGFSSSRR